MVIATEATVAVGALAPMAGIFALPLVVREVALLLVSLRAAPAVNNVLAYFLGLVPVSAVHAESTFGAVATLGTAGAFGAVAAWAASAPPGRLTAEGDSYRDAVLKWSISARSFDG